MARDSDLRKANRGRAAKSRSPQRERLSELEQVVLGIVWKRGPCTAYAVRTDFVTSRSSRFSGSAGAIYPLVKRLRALGHLRSSDEREGSTKRRLYSISESGLAELRGWLDPPFDDDVFSVQHDPIRLRLYFLEALSPARRRAFLKEAEGAFRRQIEQLLEDRARYEREGSRFSVLSIDGALAISRAQLVWIADVAEALAGGRRARSRGDTARGSSRSAKTAFKSRRRPS